MFDEPSVLILLYFTLPLWYAAGFADWVCHKKSKIEHTSGIHESALHAVMFCEIGAGLLPGLFLEINALVILVMIAMFVLHEVTAFADVTYAITKRNVTVTEQFFHSFLEIIPLMGIVTVVALHWGQFLSLFGRGLETADFSWKWKPHSLSVAYLAWTMAVIFVFHFLTYSEELLRCWRARV